MASNPRFSIEQITQSVKTLPFLRRVILGVVALGVPALFAFLLLQSREPDYGLLFSQLDEADAAQVVEKLREQKVRFRLGAGGSSVMVPIDQVYELRLQMASAGLPRGGGAGFELLDKMPLGSTGFVQRLNYVRGLQGELARTIQHLNSVEAARVHIVLPKQSLFVEDKKETTASVLLRLRAGARLSKRQISGISYLVANAVEGLDPGQVVLVDVNGNVLGSGRKDAFDQATASQLEYRIAFERNLERRVQSMLGKVVGPQNVIVRVAAELDFRRVERTEEEFNPDGAVVRSEQRSNESSKTPPPSAGAPAPGSADASARAGRESEVTNFEISKTVRHIREPVGKPKKISVAVLLGTPKPAEGDKKSAAPPNLDEDQVNQIKTLVKTAVGFDADRGDRVEVVKMAYDLSQSSKVAALTPASSGGLLGPNLWQSLIRHGSFVLVGLLVLLFVVRPMLRWAIGRPQGRGGSLQLPKTVNELETELVGETAADGTLVESHMDQLPAKASRKEKVHQIAREEPERVVAATRTWLQDEQA